MTSPPAVVFDPFSEDYSTNPYNTYRRMRDEAPVYYNPVTACTAASAQRWPAPKAPSRWNLYSTSSGTTTSTTTDFPVYG